MELEGSTLQEMAEDYEKKFVGLTKESLDRLETFTDFICGDANISDNPKSEKFCKNSHQYRMPNATIKKARKVLEKAGLEKLSDFREILAAVLRQIEAENVKQFGTLAAYDFAQRYCHSRGIQPDAVYLHAGVLTGVKALEDAGYEIKKTKVDGIGLAVALEDLPEPIRKLGTTYAENFLCVYKHQIEELPNQTKK